MNRVIWAVQVRPTLQVEGSPKVFAVGDCNDVAETKLGYLAAQQAKVAAANITALATSTASKLKIYKPAGGGPDVWPPRFSPKHKHTKYLTLALQAAQAPLQATNLTTFVYRCLQIFQTSCPIVCRFSSASEPSRL